MQGPFDRLCKVYSWPKLHQNTHKTDKWAKKKQFRKKIPSQNNAHCILNLEHYVGPNLYLQLLGFYCSKESCVKAQSTLTSFNTIFYSFKIYGK